MVTYKIKGKRYLRLYTAEQPTAAYNAKTDAKTIADTICSLPWTRSSNNYPAVLPVHSGESEQSDAENVANRMNFDACEFCAEHDDKTFRHKVFANAACYVFKLPAGAEGKTLSSISVSVSSDPYNQYGTRVAFLTNSSGELPTRCVDTRTGGYWDDVAGSYVTNSSFYKEGFAPRQVTTTTSGSVKWLSSLQTAMIEPTGGVIIGKYLFLTAQLEAYIERNNFLEGSSCLGSDVTIVLDSAIDGYADGATIDCTTDYSTEFIVCKGGVLPDITGSNGGVISVNVISTGTVPRQDESLYCTNINQIEDDSELSASNLYAGLRTLYGKFATGDVVAGDISFTNPDYRRYGVGFSIKQSNLIGYVASSGSTAKMPSTIALTASSLLVPFGLPTQFKAQRIAFDWSGWLSERTGSLSPTDGAVFNFWLHRGHFDTEYPLDILKNPALYDASLTGVSAASSGSTEEPSGSTEERAAESSDGGTSDKWELIGTASVSSGSAVFDTGDIDGYVATLLITAYYPPDMVPNTTSAFWVGTNDFFYNAVTPKANLSGDVYGADKNRMVGSSDLCIPDITLLG